MFREVIRGTALATDAANTFFSGKIDGDRMQDDVTFVSTLRALLGNRIPDGERIFFKFQRSSRGAAHYSDDQSGCQINRIIGYEETDDIPTGTIFYHRCENYDSASNDIALEYIEKYFTQVFPEFKRIQRVTDFYIKRAKILCFVNPELKTVFLFSGAINMRLYHYLQCGIYAMLPWYFASDSRPTPDEMDVIKSLRESEPTQYKTAIKKIADGLNLREIMIRKALDGFESATYRIALDKISNDMMQVQDQIDSLYGRARELHHKKSDMEIKSLGLMAKIADASGASEYMEYFLANKNLKLERCNGTDVFLVTKGYLTFFDEDNAKCVIDNPTGVMYRPGGSNYSRIISDADMKKLLYSVFIDKTIKMKVCAYYRLGRYGVSTESGHEYGDDFCDCTPNPHIDRYSCLGNYEEAINLLLNDGDYIGATEQCIAFCQSLNFGDWAVMSEFALRLYGVNRSNMNCFELPDGTVTDPKGAIEWLKAHEETKQAEVQEA